MARERRDAAPGGDVPDPGRVVAGDAREAAAGLRGGVVANFLAKFRSFSAVSAPIFANKYAFCSIF